MAEPGNCSHPVPGSKVAAGFFFVPYTEYVPLPRSCSDDILELASSSNMGEEGKWVFRVDGGSESGCCNDPAATRLQVGPAFVSPYGREPSTALS